MEVAKEWKERGDEEADALFRFFCYYLAFNWLYSDETNKNDSESKKIKKYIEETTRGWRYYDPEVFTTASGLGKNAKDVTNR